MSRTSISRASSAGRRQRVLTLLPLALLSSAVTVHLAAPGPGVAGAASSSASQPGTPQLGTPPMTPASVSTQLADEASTTGVLPAVATADVDGIPAPALAAYQRAETVINAADEGCNLSWQLLAAIGDVESHHGQIGVTRLGSDGVATPAIIGISLDGTGSTARIDDTDAGVLDGDERFDRAVGPMQFIPSTWSVVGVDSDNDGERNPQDIDDAALAAAVYLCSGSDDLSTSQGQVVAVNRYNHSAAYVERVLTLMQQYLAGGFSSTTVGGLPPVSTSPTTVAAGRIDGLHGDGERPGGSLAPAPANPADPGWQGSAEQPEPEEPDTDIEPPPDPEEPVEPPPIPITALPAAPAPTDPCNLPGVTHNATWVKPTDSKVLAWTVPGGRLVVTIQDRSTFPGGAKSHDFGRPAESGVACPLVIPWSSDDPLWPGAGAGTPWVPGKQEQQGQLSLADAEARCADEGFLAGTFEHATCLAYYAVVGTPGAPVVGTVWS